MRLKDSQLAFYVEDVLAFNRAHKQVFQSQIDYLIQTLTSSINAHTSLGVIKIVQAGSWIKGTALRPRDGVELDLDLLLYLDVREADRDDIAALHSKIIALLVKTYPQKKPADFAPSKKTVGITFHASGLKVDLVPAIPLDSPAGYVWQPEVGGSGAYRTSPPGQLEFVRALKAKDPRFASVVRLLKRWRHHAELEQPSSFVLELIAAHVLAQQGPASSIEDGLLAVLVYIAQTGLEERISFPGAIGSLPSGASVVRIHDPTNNENNCASRIGATERGEIVRAAGNAAELLNLAAIRREKGDTLAAWKHVMGTPFRIEDDG